MLFVCVCLLLSLPATTALAESFETRRGNNEVFKVRRVFRSGGFGGWNEWSTRIQDRPVESVSAIVKAARDGHKSYLTMQFDRGFRFDPARAYLTEGRVQKITWKVNGERPKGRDLILRIFDGTASVDSVIVTYGHYDKDDAGDMRRAEYARLRELSFDLENRALFALRRLRRRGAWRTSDELGAAVFEFHQHTEKFYGYMKARLYEDDARVRSEVRSLMSEANRIALLTKRTGFEDYQFEQNWDAILDVIAEIRDVSERD
jgi:hypothetical protein